MKKIQFKLIALFALTMFVLHSCDEQAILKETPLDFYSPENSYTKPEHFDLAASYIYNICRNTFYNNDAKNGYSLMAGTDYMRDGRNDGNFSIGDYRLFVPTSSQALYWWQHLYEIISCSNIIIDRIQPVEYPTEKDKLAMIAEATFFRGFCYRGLANLYGGVPITLHEVKTVKLDFVRATKTETYQQSANDLKFAAENLPEKKDVKNIGRVNRTAAYHFLAEVYLSLGKNDSAIWAANQVLQNPNFGLMTDRFGSRKSSTSGSGYSTSAGNSYWDLFQMKNQNLLENKEAIWVVQIEPDDGRLGVGNYKPERIFGPVYYSLKDPKGVNGFIGPTTKNGGRGAGYLGPTDYFVNGLWTSDWDNDLRNLEPNMIRDYVYDNPASTYFGKKVSENPGYVYDTKYYFYPIMSKTSQRGDEPTFLYATPADQAIGLLNASASKTYHDWYYARVAETYLLRAEAYLAKGMKVEAASDINAVRARVNAKPVASDDVTIDYILDERLRELAYEEPRMMTLGRLGKIYDRVSRYNSGTEGTTVAPRNNLFPIPYNEIERNTGAVLEQNPGYTN
jgi:hypothetical protein